MNRRTLLYGLTTMGVAGLSGCLQADGETSPDTETVSETASIQAIHEDDRPSGVSYALDATVITETASTDSPPSLEISFTHEGTDSADYMLGYSAPFSSNYDAEEGNPTLMFLESAADYEPIRAGCWTPDVPDSFSAATLDGLQSLTLEPGETLTRRVDVWAFHHNDEPCLPEGRFRFENQYPGPDDERITWGFEMELSA